MAKNTHSARLGGRAPCRSSPQGKCFIKFAIHAATGEAKSRGWVGRGWAGRGSWVVGRVCLNIKKRY